MLSSYADAVQCLSSICSEAVYLNIGLISLAGTIAARNFNLSLAVKQFNGLGFLRGQSIFLNRRVICKARLIGLKRAFKHFQKYGKE